MLKSRTIKIDGTINETLCQHRSSSPVKEVAFSSVAPAGRRACESRGWTERIVFFLVFGACREEPKKKEEILFSVSSDERELSPGAHLCPRTIDMATHSPARVALMFVGLLTVLAATTFNTLSEFGAKSGEAARLCCCSCCH